jgi:hypothetical protein
MSYHIKTTEYVCRGCKNVFIAYKKDLPCPYCSVPEESCGESYDFINEIAHSMRAHKQQYGYYHPGAWYTSTYADYIQGRVFVAFDVIEEKEDIKLSDFIELLNGDKSGASREEGRYIADILVLVDDAYKNLPNYKESLISKIFKKIPRDLLP